MPRGLHDFNRDKTGDFCFDLKRAMQRGHDFSDSISPENVIFKGGYFKLREQYGRVLFLADYATYIRDYVRGYEGQPPTLQDFYRELLNQPEPEAAGIALVIELFTSGSLNVFAHQTNVDMSSRVICYDLLDLGKQLKSVGMLVMLDAILNRVTQNKQRGKRTHISDTQLNCIVNSRDWAGADKSIRQSGAFRE